MKLRTLGIGLVIVIGILGFIAWKITYPQQVASHSSLWQAGFTDLEGNPKRLTAPTKRALVVNFWASWCEPCREEMGVFSAIATQWQDKIDIVGIAIDSKAEAQQFLAKVPVSYPIWLAGADVLALMRAEGNASEALPFTLIYAANGHKVAAITGKVTTEELTRLLQSATN